MAARKRQARVRQLTARSDFFKKLSLLPVWQPKCRLDETFPKRLDANTVGFRNLLIHGYPISPACGGGLGWEQQRSISPSLSVYRKEPARGQKPP